MGLFNKIKKEIKHVTKHATIPNGMISYRGVQFYLVNDESSLPNDKNILIQMSKYYNDYTVCKDMDNREEKLKMILKKTYPLIQDDEDRDAQIVKELYLQHFCSQDELNKQVFNTFINKIKNAEFSLEELNRRVSQGESVFPDSYIFTWFSNSKIENEYVEQNMLILFNTIWELVEKERKEEQALYLGYWMYKELYDYYQNGDSFVRFKKSLWSKTSRYYTCAYRIYNLAPVYLKMGEKSKAKNCLDKKTEIEQMNKIAKDNLHLLKKEDLYTRFNNIQLGLGERDAKYAQGKSLLLSYLTEDENKKVFH